MQTDTYSNLLALVRGLSGNTSFATAEDTLVGSFINRRIYNAYRRSAYWPRYLVLGEEREVSSSTVASTALALSTKYTIVTSGTTDWVLMGSPDTTVGTSFTVNTLTGNATALTNRQALQDKDGWYHQLHADWRWPTTTWGRSLRPQVLARARERWT